MARRGWRIRRPIQKMFRADIIVIDLFRFDCQLELMCLANYENAERHRVVQIREYMETAVEATVFTV
jgi:hypothetical protein